MAETKKAANGGRGMGRGLAAILSSSAREESGLREILNYGHTFGHAVEQLHRHRVPERVGQPLADHRADHAAAAGR